MMTRVSVHLPFGRTSASSQSSSAFAFESTRDAAFSAHARRSVVSLSSSGVSGLSPREEARLVEIGPGKLLLKPADHDCVELLLVGLRHAAVKTLVVEELEQGDEALRVPVVRGRCEEHLVLEVRGERADALRAKRVD